MHIHAHTDKIPADTIWNPDDLTYTVIWRHMPSYAGIWHAISYAGIWRHMLLRKSYDVICRHMTAYTFREIIWRHMTSYDISGSVLVYTSIYWYILVYTVYLPKLWYIRVYARIYLYILFSPIFERVHPGTSQHIMVHPVSTCACFAPGCTLLARLKAAHSASSSMRS